MVIRTAAALAFYCQKCGKIEIHDLSRFTLKEAGFKELVCNCGQHQGRLIQAGSKQLILEVPCVLCGTSHFLHLDSDLLWRGKISKIYCPLEKFELGFMGERTALEEQAARYQHEVEQEEYFVNAWVMLEMINWVHDMAEQGKLFCRCGSGAIETDILPDRIDLTCSHCESRKVLYARGEQDLHALKSLNNLELTPIRCSRHKH